jgi:manganese transport protein
MYVAIGILGATVMPHNLYLHSALVQTRRIGGSEQEKQSACDFNLVDSSIALNGALTGERCDSRGGGSGAARD